MTSDRFQPPTARNRNLSVKRLWVFSLAIACSSPLLVAPIAYGQDNATVPAVKPAAEGQADLDEAIVKRIGADTPQALEAVSALLESAIKKGLDEENQAFAKKMLGSVLLQRAESLIATFPQAADQRGGLSSRQIAIRSETLEILARAVENDPELVEGFLLIARLHLMPGGEREEIKKATTSAIGLLDDEPKEQSSAYVLRALTNETDEGKLADLDAALKADPDNKEAIQMRASIRLDAGDIEGAIGDLEKVLVEDPTNTAFAGSVIQKLVDRDRVAEARELVTKMLAAKPSEGMYRMRAILHREEGQLDEAMADLDKAIAMAPKDPMTLLQRSGLALERDDLRSAKADFRAAIQVMPLIAEADEGIELRMQIAIAEKRNADAINDAKLLVDRAPDSTFRKLRLATLYTIDERPRKAIEVLTDILAGDPENVGVLRTRGDALLSVGDHKAAIADYESAIAAIGNLDPQEASKRDIDEASGLYNNLAWVLATSPNDDIRNGARALELAEKSAELTNHEAPHILSTLAAAYAEQGDYENARKWSGKAVELAADQEHNQLEQLEEELEKYKQNEPWREKQETEENAIPILDPEDLIDT
ncbi:tetratricopeptide repeat protein [Rubripirellula amarantea]|uniref:Tetratricopeptide repeat protein n=1 Tax=Rubripirellula amarantea TaxID=2527999 RepID=A0A5C5WX75_9BACT|nr:tetratricopeptide repeat protein [Rubripirellula amarantea]MDA8744134.1 tetratricopeptide repeat protein [Rubripirellula amarantea]TWT54472.1 tetratricopeptide repeat protein [Rubripirellula amarantea]